MLPQIERMKTSRKVTKFLYGGATLQIKYYGIRDLGIKVPITLGYSIFYPYRGVEGNLEEYFLSKSLNGFRLSPPPWK